MAELMIERIVPWRLNGQAQPSFLCTPEHLDELAAGYLFTQGTIASLNDIAAITGDESGLSVTLRPDVAPQRKDILERLNDAPPCRSDLTVPLSELHSMCELLLSEKSYFGTHRLMLSCGGQAVFREDVGRHNAADKCIAHALANKWQLSQSILGSTGRISLEMLAKAAVAGIPVFFSRKYPSDIVVEWAERLNMALVIRAHSDAPTLYGAAWRIK